MQNILYGKESWQPSRDHETPLAKHYTGPVAIRSDGCRRRVEGLSDTTQARVEEARDRIRKCSIFSPIDGTVLRVFPRAGESFSTVTPRPLFTVADASGRRVKAEVDERDLGRLVVGQVVAVEADGFPGKKFSGKVSSVSAVIGSKKFSQRIRLRKLIARSSTQQ